MKAVKRHLFKTVTWRVIGTLDTIVIAYFISGSWKTGAAIGGIELFTKMGLYFLHERAWYSFRKKVK